MEKGKIDKIFLAAFLSLLLWGFFAFAATSIPFSLKNSGNSWHYLWRQIIFGFLPGFFLFFAFLKIDNEKLKKISFFLFLLNFILMVAVLVPGLGIKMKGARRWINFAGISFQPAEFLKITFLLYLSAWLANKPKIRKKEGGRSLFYFYTAVIFLLAILFYFQRDLSTFFVIAASSFVLYVFGSPSFKQVIVSVFLVVFVIFSIFIILSPMRIERIRSAFSQEESDFLGAKYQAKQAEIAIGSGSVFGIGGGLSYGMSQQKLGFLPEAMSDSIFAVVAEETGFVGSVLLVMLFFIFGWRGIKIGLKAKNDFLKFLAFSLSFWISFQAFLNISGISGLLGVFPIAGIPLPFFSQGASHLAAELGAAGLILKASKK